MCEIISSTLASRLQYALRASGRSQTDIATESGITSAYLSEMKKGRRDNPSVAVLQKLAQACGVDFAWLAHGNTAIEPADLLLESPKATPQELTSASELGESSASYIIRDIAAHNPQAVISQIASYTARIAGGETPLEPLVQILLAQLAVAIREKGQSKKSCHNHTDCA